MIPTVEELIGRIRTEKERYLKEHSDGTREIRNGEPITPGMERYGGPSTELIMNTPDDYEKAFDPDAYFQHYFGEKSITDGTRVSLFCLPVFAYIIKNTIPAHERQTLLDIGAGPTVYSALCFRDVVEKIYLSDFVQKNLTALQDWTSGVSNHDWNPTIKVILRSEGNSAVNGPDLLEHIEKQTIGMVKQGGIMFSNVHEHPCVPELAEQQVDIIVSVFCLESACSNYDEYRLALKNMLAHLRSGGKFILGSVLDDDIYNSGNQVMFRLCRLSEDQILNALAEAGCDIETRKNYTLEDEGVMFLMVNKQ